MSDALSDVLRSVRLRGGVFLDARFTSPWAVSSFVTAEACKPMLERPAQLIGYHLMIEGRMLLSVGGEPPVDVGAGEVVLLPRNDVHVLMSSPGIEPVDGHSLVEPAPDGGLARVDYGGGGAAARMVCGFLGCEDSFNPLIDSLPRVLKIDIRKATSREMIEASLAFAAGELAQGRLAASGVLSRLSELLLIEAVRRYASDMGDNATGWLRGLNDPNIGRALAIIHRDIAATWTAEGLAREVGMSRSAFVDRFTTLVGTPPIRYLTRWRIDAAKLALRETSKSIAQIGYGVGYESEEAFSRAFKRETGCAPAHWRDQQKRA